MFKKFVDNMFDYVRFSRSVEVVWMKDLTIAVLLALPAVTASWSPPSFTTWVLAAVAAAFMIICLFDVADAVREARKKVKAEPTPEERVALKHSELAYWYAHHVLRRRWPEGEPVILEDSASAYWYTRYVLKQRWPEAEPVIMKDPNYAYWYAYYVLKQRWPEAEQCIRTDSEVWEAYEKAFDFRSDEEK